MHKYLAEIDKAMRMKLGVFWSDDRLGSVLALSKETTMGATQIAQHTGISHSAILRLENILKYGIRVGGKAANWSDHEIYAVKRGVAENRPIAEVAEEINRSLEAVQRKAAQLRGKVERKEAKLPPTIDYRYGSVNALLMGDPPVGRSFLERRQRGEV